MTLYTVSVYLPPVSQITWSNTFQWLLELPRVSHSFTTIPHPWLESTVSLSLALIITCSDKDSLWLTQTGTTSNIIGTHVMLHMLVAWSVNMEEFLDAASSRLPTLRGIIYTSTDLHQLSRCVLHSGGRYAMVYGCDQVCHMQVKYCSTATILASKGHHRYQAWAPGYTSAFSANIL